MGNQCVMVMYLWPGLFLIHLTMCCHWEWMNLSGEPQKLYKGTNIATCEPVVAVRETSFVDHISPMSHTESGSPGKDDGEFHLPAHIGKLIDDCEEYLTADEKDMVECLVHEFQQGFAKSKNGLSTTDVDQHSMTRETGIKRFSFGQMWAAQVGWLGICCIVEFMCNPVWLDVDVRGRWLRQGSTPGYLGWQWATKNVIPCQCGDCCPIAADVYDGKMINKLIEQVGPLPCWLPAAIADVDQGRDLEWWEWSEHHVYNYRRI